MAKVKVTLLTARVDGNVSNSSGDVIEVDAAEAKRMFDAELAVPAVAKKATRTAKASSADVESR